MSTTAQIGPETRVSKSDNFVESNVDDEAILMHLEEGSFSSVRSTGLRIWQLIDEPRSVAEICDALRREFDVGEIECREQTTEFLSHLCERGLIQIEKG